ncbi:MAG: helix-turn-helix domain-containing protein [Lacipirellulaceae bacterium]
MADKQPPTMTEVLRDALLSDPRSFAEVSRQTGITRQSLMPFARGERSLRLDLADKLAAFYGLELGDRGDTTCS